MQATDLIFYILPVLIIGGVVLYRWRKKPAPLKNLFRTGGAVKLTKRIELNNLIKREAFIEANSQLVSKFTFTKVWQIFYIVIGAFLLISLIASYYSTGGNEIKVDYTSYWPILVLIAIYLLLRYITKFGSGRTYDNTEAIKHPSTYIFDPDFYETSNQLTTAKCGWETIHGFMETEKYLMVFTGPIIALFLDKQAFAPGDLDLFKTFLNTNFEAKKKLY